MRHEIINLRASLDQCDLINHAAKLLGMNRSDFMLEAACDRAQAVLLGQSVFNLGANRFKQFTKLLDAPPGPNPALERLLTVEAPWRTDPGEAGTK